jgi:hypothetical protein
MNWKAIQLKNKTEKNKISIKQKTSQKRKKSAITAGRTGTLHKNIILNLRISQHKQLSELKRSHQRKIRCRWLLK